MVLFNLQDLKRFSEVISPAAAEASSVSVRDRWPRSNSDRPTHNYIIVSPIFGKIGRMASDESELQLIKGKRLPILLHGLEACLLKNGS